VLPWICLGGHLGHKKGLKSKTGVGKVKKCILKKSYIGGSRSSGRWIRFCIHHSFSPLGVILFAKCFRDPDSGMLERFTTTYTTWAGLPNGIGFGPQICHLCDPQGEPSGTSSPTLYKFKLINIKSIENI
jgi:hypothetical protein